VSALPDAIEEYCASCGSWVSFLNFNYDTGWCTECSGQIDDRARCIHCSNVLQGSDQYRTTCRTCRQENWLTEHGDQIELLMIVRGLTFQQARVVIIEISRPICQACKQPIKGAKTGALFHKRNENKACHTVYLKFKSLTKSGLTIDQALARLH
jgi:hypothetical protein